MDVAATAQYNQDALKLKGEKTSLLPAPAIYQQEDDVKAEGVDLLVLLFQRTGVGRTSSTALANTICAF